MDDDPMVWPDLPGSDGMFWQASDGTFRPARYQRLHFEATARFRQRAEAEDADPLSWTTPTASIEEHVTPQTEVDLKPDTSTPNAVQITLPPLAPDPIPAADGAIWIAQKGDFRLVQSRPAE